VAVGAGCWLSSAQAIDKNKPYARVCFAVMNSTTGEEVALQATSTPGKGNKIVAHIDATAKCEAVVAAFNRKTGQLVNNWLPQFIEVTERNEVLLPKAPVVWDWGKETGPLELHVLIFAPGSKEGAELKNLVGAMQNAGTQKIAELQANKLRELIGRAKVDKLASDRGVKTTATEVGGVFRMAVGFEWRDSARSVNFSADKPAALVFP
jgi:hypothetical protein